MSISLRRYQADESEFTKSGRRRAMITIPGSIGYTDLSESKVMLEITPTVTTDAGVTPVPWPVTFTQPTGRTNADYSSKASVTGAQALIRNARVVSRDHGLMNEQRHQNVISTNLDWYQSSRAQEEEKNLFGNTLSNNYGRQSNFVAASPFFSYKQPNAANTTQDQLGVVHQATIPVDWKHIDQFAQMRQFPNAAVGDIDYHIEFEDQIDVIQLAESPVNVKTITNANSGAAGQMPALVTDRDRSQIVHPLSVGEQVYIRFIEGGNVKQSFCRVATIAENGTHFEYTVTPAIAGLGNNSACEEIAIFHGSAIQAGARAYYPTNIAANNIAANGWAGDANNPLVFDNFFGTDTVNNPVDYTRNPFVPGQFVCLHYTTEDANANAAYAHVYTTVASVSIANGANGQPVDMQLVLDEPANNPFIANKPVTDMVVSIPDHAADGNPFAVDWTINEVYLQMNVLNLQQQQQENARKALQEGLQIPWLEQRLVQKHMSQTTTLAEVIELLPNCLGVAVLTPQNLQLASEFDNCQSYRFALDGKDTTDRDIPVGMWTSNRSLHDLQLKRYFANMGKPLMKYDAPWINRSATLDNTNTMSFYPLVVPQKEGYTVLQLQLFSTNAMSEKNIFFVSTHERMLQFKDGRVQVM